MTQTSHYEETETLIRIAISSVLPIIDTEELKSKAKEPTAYSYTL